MTLSGVLAACAPDRECSRRRRCRHIREPASTTRAWEWRAVDGSAPSLLSLTPFASLAFSRTDEQHRAARVSCDAFCDGSQEYVPDTRASVRAHDDQVIVYALRSLWMPHRRNDGFLAMAHNPRALEFRKATGARFGWSFVSPTPTHDPAIRAAMCAPCSTVCFADPRPGPNFELPRLFRRAYVPRERGNAHVARPSPRPTP